MKKKTTEEWITRFKEVHGDKFDYSKFNVNNFDEKRRGCIICPKHGEFWQDPYEHSVGKGCKQCHFEKLKILKSKGREAFVSEASLIHNGNYDYSEINYVNNTVRVGIICPIHGKFYQAPSNHLRGQGCPHCKTIKIAEKLGNYIPVGSSSLF